MVIFWSLSLLFYIMLSGDSQHFIHPQTLWEIGATTQPAPLECRSLTDGERAERHYNDAGKVANFKIAPEALCPQGIFDYGERAAYTEFMTQNIPKISHQVATHFSDWEAKLIERGVKEESLEWYLEVEAPQADWQHYLLSVFQVELAQTTRGKIIQAKGTPQKNARIKIELKASIIREEMLDVQGEYVWQGERLKTKL